MSKSFLIDFVKRTSPCRKAPRAGACESTGGVFCKGPPSQAPTAAPSNAPTISPLDVCKAENKKLTAANDKLTAENKKLTASNAELEEFCRNVIM